MDKGQRFIGCLLAVIAAVLLAAGGGAARSAGKVGACFLPAFDCPCIEVTEQECAEQGGVYRGDGTDCETAECEDWDGCCLPDATCVEVFRFECELQMGRFGGHCDGNNCVPFGGCCRPDGVCLVIDESECIDGALYLGDGVVCEPDACEIGACCIPASGTCEIITVWACDFEGGEWFGPDSNCDDANFNGNPDVCETCRSDSNDDGVVDFIDLLTLLQDWGPCDP